MEPEKILFVDDEPAVLEAYKRLLDRDFHVDTAVGPEAGLAAIDKNGPYAVVVSDMRMPHMDGAQFLARVRSAAPDTVRLALTGHADIETSMQAVNEGHIFRFLTKPCPREVLRKALISALEQYRLIIAEKELLEKTLRGSVKVLTEVINMVNPMTFSRSTRIQRCAQHMANKLGVAAPWRIELAAMLSQLGCLIIHPDLVSAVYAGHTLSAENQARFNSHPWIARDLLANIPRLEAVAWMIAHQESSLEEQAAARDGQPEDVVMGARILSVAVAYDRLLSQGNSPQQSLSRLRARKHTLDPAVVELLVDMEPAVGEIEFRSCTIGELQPGMVLQEEIRTQAGVLVVAKGQEVTYPLTIRLRNFLSSGAIPGRVQVMVPHYGEQPAEAKA